MIICGDFGYLLKDDKTEQLFLDLLNQRGHTICFVNENHNHFPVLYSYPIETWNKGKVHKIRDNILHFIHGQMNEMENKTLFVFDRVYRISKLYRKEDIYGTTLLLEKSKKETAA